MKCKIVTVSITQVHYELIIFDFKAKTLKLMLSQLDIVLILNWRRFATYMLKEKFTTEKTKSKASHKL